MKLIQNYPNNFDCKIIIDGIEFSNQTITIYFYIGKNKNYYYKIFFNKQFLEYLQNYFSDEYIEGVKGFGQHIILNDKFNLTFKEKSNQLEFITYDNHIFIHGYLKK
jgi:hypothetical protein